MDDIRKGLGKRIRFLRESKGLTQEVLGEKAELSYKFVGEVERGEVNISLDSLINIADALEVKINDLFPSEKDIFPHFSLNEIQLIKEALRLLNRTFSKV